MANPDHLARLRLGTQAWNLWRKEHPDIVPDLSWEDFRELNLSGINLARAHLRAAKFQNAVMSNGIFWKADLAEAELHEAILHEANLRKANLFAAKLTGANLRRANLTGTLFVDTDLRNADLTGCFVYGCSVWDAALDGAIQRDLVIVNVHSSSNEWRPGELTESLLTVDDLEIAQFIYLLRANEKIRNVIDTMNSKVVLILGRFTLKRKEVLDALKEKLREKNYVPVIFDFDKPDSKNLTETIGILASWARFVIADITDAKSIPQELERIVPDLPSLPVQPLILSSQYEYAMFKDFLDFPWVLLPYRYDSLEMLLVSLEENVISPVEAKVKEIKERRMAIEQGMKKAGAETEAKT
jgi:uncharacterized protein YjbI with pentapeptide repeats